MLVLWGFAAPQCAAKVLPAAGGYSAPPCKCKVAVRRLTTMHRKATKTGYGCASRSAVPNTSCSRNHKLRLLLTSREPLVLLHVNNQMTLALTKLSVSNACTALQLQDKRGCKGALPVHQQEAHTGDHAQNKCLSAACT